VEFVAKTRVTAGEGRRLRTAGSRLTRFNLEPCSLHKGRDARYRGRGPGAGEVEAKIRSDVVAEWLEEAFRSH